MNRFAYMVAGVFLTAGLASAVEKDRPEPKDSSAKATGHSAKQQEDQYAAAVKQCEGMQAKEKQSCIESAKERHGEMLR